MAACLRRFPMVAFLGLALLAARPAAAQTSGTPAEAAGGDNHPSSAEKPAAVNKAAGNEGAASQATGNKATGQPVAEQPADANQAAGKSAEPTPAKDIASDAKPAANVPLSAEQAKLAGKYKELERVILRMAEVMQTTDPKRAALLRQAFAQSKEKQINSQYEDLVKLLEQQQLYQASKGQAAMQQDLDQLLQLLLSGERDKQIPNERAEIKRYIERINKLIREEQGVQGETEGQGDAGDLIKAQENIAKKTSELGKDLSKLEALNGPSGGTGDKSADPADDKSGTPKSDGQNSDDKNPDGKKSDGKNSDGKNADGKNPDGKNTDGKTPDENNPLEGKDSDQQNSKDGKADGKSDGKSGKNQKGDNQKNDSQKNDGSAKDSKPGEKGTDQPGDKQDGQSGQPGDEKAAGKAGDQSRQSKPNGGKSGQQSSGQQKSGQPQANGQNQGDQKSGDQKSDGQKSGDQKSGDQKSDGRKQDNQKSAGKPNDQKSDKKWERSDQQPTPKSDGKQQPEQPDNQSGGNSEQKSNGNSPSKQQGKQQNQSPNGQPNDNDDADKQNNPSGDQQSEDDPSGRKRVQQAEERMHAAKRKLEEAQRRGAAEEEQQAVEALKQAKAQLEEILRQLREEEIERVLAQLEGRFHKMLDMQVEVYEGTMALDRTAEQDRDRDTEMEASKLGRKEAEIVGEADKALELLHEEGSSVAFPESVEQSREDMDQVRVRLDRTNIGQITQGIEQDIVKSLEETVASLHKAQKDQQEHRAGGNNGGGGGGGGGQQDQPLVDSIAELKMIRALQMRVNTRTQRYSKLLQDGAEQAEAPDLLEAVQRLSEREQRIYQTTHDIVVEKNK